MFLSQYSGFNASRSLVLIVFPTIALPPHAARKKTPPPPLPSPHPLQHLSMTRKTTLLPAPLSPPRLPYAADPCPYSTALLRRELMTPHHTRRPCPGAARLFACRSSWHMIQSWAQPPGTNWWQVSPRHGRTEPLPRRLSL